MKALKLLCTPLLASLAAALVLVACEKPDEPLAASAALDEAISSVVQTVRPVEPGKPGEVGECSDASTPDARTGDAGSEAHAAASKGALRDAVIAVDVSDRLAQDPGLKALAIAVDATCGRIALRGSAPDAPTRERATQLALVVNGVTAVDNRLALFRGL